MSGDQGRWQPILALGGLSSQSQGPAAVTVLVIMERASNEAGLLSAED